MVGQSHHSSKKNSLHLRLQTVVCSGTRGYHDCVVSDGHTPLILVFPLIGSSTLVQTRLVCPRALCCIGQMWASKRKHQTPQSSLCIGTQMHHPKHQHPRVHMHSGAKFVAESTKIQHFDPLKLSSPKPTPLIFKILFLSFVNFFGVFHFINFFGF